MANFPTSLPGLTTAYVDNVDDIMATNQNTPNGELNALAAKVGIDSSAVTTSHDYKLSAITGTNRAQAIPLAWTSWTPSWTNVTIGNATVTAYYSQVGKTVHCRLAVVWGSTTSASGDHIFSLPVTAVTYPAGKHAIGTAAFFDTGGGVPNISGTVNWATTTTGGFKHFVVSGSFIVPTVLSATAPWTWTTGDGIYCSFTYEAA